MKSSQFPEARSQPPPRDLVSYPPGRSRQEAGSCGSGHRDTDLQLCRGQRRRIQNAQGVEVAHRPLDRVDPKTVDGSLQT